MNPREVPFDFAQGRLSSAGKSVGLWDDSGQLALPSKSENYFCGCVELDGSARLEAVEAGTVRGCG
jgi:hypothetical protein